MSTDSKQSHLKQQWHLFGGRRKGRIQPSSRTEEKCWVLHDQIHYTHV